MLSLLETIDEIVYTSGGATHVLVPVEVMEQLQEKLRREREIELWTAGNLGKKCAPEPEEET